MYINSIKSVGCFSSSHVFLFFLLFHQNAFFYEDNNNCNNKILSDIFWNKKRWNVCVSWLVLFSLFKIHYEQNSLWILFLQLFNHVYVCIVLCENVKIRKYILYALLLLIRMMMMCVCLVTFIYKKLLNEKIVYF